MTGDSLSDFPDRLSPMLVNELRQGLRAKTFVAVFLSLQAVMALILFSAGVAAEYTSAGSVISSIIFIFFSITVLVVQPLRGIGAISSEVKGNTIDMMVLTRLSALRIVYGKWFAIVSQSALLLATIIPYLILRYFFGGMNLIGEMVLLVLIFLTSMALTAITVGLSGCTSVILRALLPMIGLPVLFISLVENLVSSSRRGSVLIEYCSMSTPGSLTLILLYLVSITYLGWSLLSLGASLIAPAAENHSTLRRLVALVVSLIVLWFSTTSHFEADALPYIFVLIAFPAIGTALTERRLSLASLTAPFNRRGVPGKIAGCFLLPGWPAGVFFTLLLSVIFVIPLTGLLPGSHTFSDEEQVAVLSLMAWFLFPALVLIVIRAEESSRITAYFLLLVSSGILAVIIEAVAQALNNDNLLWFFIWNPLTLIALINERPSFHQNVPVAAMGVTAIYMLLLAIPAMVALMRQGEARRTEAP